MGVTYPCLDQDVDLSCYNPGIETTTSCSGGGESHETVTVSSVDPEPQECMQVLLTDVLDVPALDNNVVDGLSSGGPTTNIDVKVRKYCPLVGSWMCPLF